MDNEKRLIRNSERFWSKVRCPSVGCWVWVAGTDRDGYGRIWINGNTLMAHRYSWEIHFGPIPEGLNVLHHCDNPPCIRPSHIFTGTAADNNRDCRNKGRHGCGINHGSAQGTSKLTEIKVRVIRAYENVISKKGLAEIFKVDATTISHIHSHHSWRHI